MRFIATSITAKTVRLRVALAATTATVGLLASGCAADTASADGAPPSEVQSAATPAASSPSGGERTRAAFVADTVPLCTTLVEARTAKAKKYFPSETAPPTLAQIQGFYADFAPDFATFALGFADLVPAPADRAMFDELSQGAFVIAAKISSAGQEEKLAQHLLDTDEAEFKEGTQPAAIGIDPEC